MNFLQKIGLFLVIFFIALAFIGLFFLPGDTVAQQIQWRFQAPNTNYWLGTDHYGRDILAMLTFGAGNSLFIAMIAVFIGAIIGVILTLLVWIFRLYFMLDWINFISNGLLAFPALLTALILAAFYPPGFLTVMIAIALYNIPIFAKLTLTVLTALNRSSYVTAAIALGQDRVGIFRKHLIKPLLEILIVQFAVQVSFALLAEAGLSYLGFGINYPNISWGKMLFDSQTFINDYPWLVIWPGLCISSAILGFQLFAEWLRKKLDIPH